MINDPKLPEKENMQSTFAFKQEVIITTGFYRGRKAFVTKYDTKTKKYTVETYIDDKKHIIICEEDELKAKRGWFGK